MATKKPQKKSAAKVKPAAKKTVKKKVAVKKAAAEKSRRGKSRRGKSGCEKVGCQKSAGEKTTSRQSKNVAIIGKTDQEIHKCQEAPCEAGETHYIKAPTLIQTRCTKEIRFHVCCQETRKSNAEKTCRKNQRSC